MPLSAVYRVRCEALATSAALPCSCLSIVAVQAYSRQPRAPLHPVYVSSRNIKTSALQKATRA
ncbi:MAG: hypothetical protein [Inoviridae sp.]|nr:MAG: hypothetical protein [Inoviridae sp.]